MTETAIKTWLQTGRFINIYQNNVMTNSQSYFYFCSEKNTSKKIFLEKLFKEDPKLTLLP